MTQTRELRQIINGDRVSDGAGVQLTRIIGSPQLNMLDPFLMFDAFGSDKPQDYIAGFPPHPHRGFETVTYMLEGRMRHEDSAGNAGVIETGGVQWMTAGKGIIHSEMPEQKEGRLAGFQLWVNLPATEKMNEPKYQEFDAEQIPVARLDNGTAIKVIAGQTDSGV
ncbi:pirin family protein, partial [Methylophaga sp. UBA3991]